MKTSLSEDHGIALLTDKDLRVYSVGISTGGIAEMRMARLHPKRHIVATTIDEKGIATTQDSVSKRGLEQQIELKLEDVSAELPYADGSFDFIYARLVLHYLSKQKLTTTLKELHRILKRGGQLFVVVRSSKCEDANQVGKTYDETTSLTTYPQTNPHTGEQYTQARFFHTKKSIGDYLKTAGFKIKYVKSYDEQLSLDFMRTQPSGHYDEVIELLGVKS